VTDHVSSDSQGHLLDKSQARGRSLETKRTESNNDRIGIAFLRCPSKLRHATVHRLFCFGKITEIKARLIETLGTFPFGFLWDLNWMQQGSATLEVT
jgi:hypothetical protein